MADTEDIRWIQRFDNFERACAKVTEITGTRPMDSLSDLEKEGLIQRFEYTFELAWKVMQDYLRYLGFDFQPGPNSTIRLALENGIISDHDGWRNIASDRIVTSLTYDEDDADEVIRNIYESYAGLFSELKNYLASKKNI